MYEQFQSVLNKFNNPQEIEITKQESTEDSKDLVYQNGDSSENELMMKTAVTRMMRKRKTTTTAFKTSITYTKQNSISKIEIIGEISSSC